MRFALLLAALAVPLPVASAQTVVDWRAMPLTAGSWAYRGLADGSEAVFTDASATRRVVVKCSRPARRVALQVTSAAAAPTITVRTTETERILQARFDPQTFQIIAEVAATEPLLDAIAFSRGRFSVMVPGGAALIVPGWPEVARSIEDCRL